MTKVSKTSERYEEPFQTTLRNLLDQTGTTQQSLADSIGVKRQTISQWKDGITLPDIDSLCKMADFFKVPTDFLLGRSDVKSFDTDIQAIHGKTGLSEKAISVLERLESLPLISGMETNISAITFMNGLLENKRFLGVLELMANAINEKYQFEQERSLVDNIYFYYWKLEHFTKLWTTEVLKRLFEEHHQALEQIDEEIGKNDSMCRSMLGELGPWLTDGNFETEEINSD